MIFGKNIKNVANRIRTCAGFPSRFLVCRLNHSAIATISIITLAPHSYPHFALPSPTITLDYIE
jgi:hypothetical protein